MDDLAEGLLEGALDALVFLAEPPKSKTGCLVYIVILALLIGTIMYVYKK